MAGYFRFAEPRQARSYTYSIVDQQPTLHKGVFAGLEQAWSGPHGNTKPFPIIAVKIDTVAAYQTALKNGGAEYDKNPGQTDSLSIEKVDKYPDPVWRVIWGESAGTSNSPFTWMPRRGTSRRNCTRRGRKSRTAAAPPSPSSSTPKAYWLSLIMPWIFLSLLRISSVASWTWVVS